MRTAIGSDDLIGVSVLPSRSNPGLPLQLSTSLLQRPLCLSGEEEEEENNIVLLDIPNTKIRHRKVQWPGRAYTIHHGFVITYFAGLIKLSITEISLLNRTP